MARNVGPIQVALAGLYGLLGVKDGSNPDVITGFVQPTLDATPWWLRATMNQLTQATTISATGAAQTVLLATVPQNEWWYVHRATLLGQMDITTMQPGYYVRFTILDANVGNAYYVTPPRPLAIDAAGNVYDQVGPSVARPQVTIEELWVPPGARIYVEGQGDPTNPDTFICSPLYGSACRV